jgi:hypothetical protein
MGTFGAMVKHASLHERDSDQHQICNSDGARASDIENPVGRGTRAVRQLSKPVAGHP